MQRDFDTQKESQFSPVTDEFVDLIPFSCAGRYIKIADMPCKVVDNTVYCYKPANLCIPIRVPGEDLWVPPSALELELGISD